MNAIQVYAAAEVGGHEVIGKVVAMGDQASNHTIGDRVGLGWFSRSCTTCCQCLAAIKTFARKSEEPSRIKPADLPNGCDAIGRGPHRSRHHCRLKNADHFCAAA